MLITVTKGSIRPKLTVSLIQQSYSRVITILLRSSIRVLHFVSLNADERGECFLYYLNKNLIKLTAIGPELYIFANVRFGTQKFGQGGEY